MGTHETVKVINSALQYEGIAAWSIFKVAHIYNYGRVLSPLSMHFITEFTTHCKERMSFGKSNESLWAVVQKLAV